MKIPFRYFLVFIAFFSAAATILACGSSEQQVTGSDVVPEPTGTPVPAPVGDVYSVGEGSEATFTINEKLSRLTLPNDAVLRTGEISGEIDLSKGFALLVINLHALKSDQSSRDSYVRDRTFPRQPDATTSITEFPEIPASFADGETFTSSVIANVNVNGTDAEIEFSVEARLDPDRLLVLVKDDFV